MTALDSPRERRTSRNRLTGRLHAARVALTAWLGRPLASFHLILAICALLVVLGLVMVLSASSVISLQQDASAYTVFGKQVVFVLVGLVLFWLGLRVPLQRIRAASPAMLWVSLLMLVLVLVPGLGTEINSTRSWFTFGPVGFQPVEVAKVALALWGAHILVVKRGVLHLYRHLLVPVVPVALMMFALIMLQPDLGGTITLGVVLIALLWFAGAQLRLFGKGLGQGPSKYKYLPNVHNDFIFALIGEELGFLGCALVLGLFAMLAVVGMRIATRNIDPWIRLVAATLTVWLVAQAAINIGYVVNLLPVTGITLPLISSGGTSVVITLLVFGILANCARHEPESVAALRSQGPGRFGRLMRLPAPDPYQPPARRRPARTPARPRGPADRRRYPRSSRGGTS